MRLFLFVVLASFCFETAFGQTYTISTFAGGHHPANAPGVSANLYGPSSVAVDRAGNVFFSDSCEHVIYRLDATSGVLTVAAGNGSAGFSGDNGPALNAQLDNPAGVAVDSAGNLYIADRFNSRVRRVTNGVISTVAGNGSPGFSGDGSAGTASRLNYPVGVAVDSAGELYIADTGNERIRKVASGIITTVAGTGTAGFSGDYGPATSARLNQPTGAAMDTSGNLYISDQSNNRIREVSNGVISTVAGNGTGGFSGDGGLAIAAKLFVPNGVAVDTSGSLYISDAYNSRIRKVADGVISTIVGVGCCGFSGDNGPATSARLSAPYGVAVDANGNLYIADNAYNKRVRKVAHGVITTVAGNGLEGDNGPASGALLLVPPAVAVDRAGDVLITDFYGESVRVVTDGFITTVTGSGTAGFGGDGGPANTGQVNSPDGLAVDLAGNVYIADEGNNRIREIANGTIVTVAGSATQGFSGDNGPATAAGLNQPGGIAVDALGNLYIAGSDNNRVRRVANGIITTAAGNGTAGYKGDGGPALSSELDLPLAVALDSAGNLYIADSFNHRIRKVSGGVISTIAGDGNCGFRGDNGPAASAELCYPEGVALDSADNLFIADTYNNRIRKVANGTITTVAGNGAQGFTGDGGAGTAAELDSPQGIAVDELGNVYVSDVGNNRVRVLTPGNQPTINPNGVVPVYSSVPVVQPGSWVSIYGTNLASTTALWNSDFPQSLGGVTVNIDNKPAYLWVVSPTQINLQVPDDATTGMVSVVVNTPTGTATSTVTLAAQGPSFSLLGDDKHVAGEIPTPNGTGAYGGGTYDLVGPSNAFPYSTRPVKAGETLILFGVGFGPTTPAVPAGKAFSGSAPTNYPVTVTIGGVNASVSYSGITEAGLYQFNLTVPANTGSGGRALQATVNGVRTPAGPVVTVQ